MRLKRRTLLGLAASTTILSGCTGGAGTQPTETAETAEPVDESTPTPTATSAPTDTATPTATPTAAAPHVRVASHADLGEILVGPDGMTLYMFDDDSKGASESTCYDSCAESWPPLTVAGEPSAGEGVDAELAAFERETGDRQVAAAGWPLYYFASDEEPGDATGQGAGDVWWVLRPDGAPVKPEPTATTAGGDGNAY